MYLHRSLCKGRFAVVVLFIMASVPTSCGSNEERIAIAKMTEAAAAVQIAAARSTEVAALETLTALGVTGTEESVSPSIPPSTASPEPVEAPTAAQTEAPGTSSNATATARVIAAREAATVRLLTSTAEGATATAQAPALFASSTAESMTSTAGAPTRSAEQTARAKANMTEAVEDAATATARIVMATAKAPVTNPTGTAKAVNAQATATFAGVVVSAPPEVRWEAAGSRHRWEWNTDFEEIAGRVITVTKKSGILVTVDGKRYYTGNYDLDIRIPAHGKASDSFWISGTATTGDAHEALFIMTYEFVDDTRYRFSVNTVITFKNEGR